MEELKSSHCIPCEGTGIAPLNQQEVTKLLTLVPQWQANDDFTCISRHFEFKGFYKTMGFVNAVAWIANTEGHHPTLNVGYNFCTVHFTTHALGGLSRNDFICAAKVNQLIDESSAS